MESSSTGMYVAVDFHYYGMFSPNPLVYLDPVKTSEFVETVYSLESELDVYIDHQNEPLLDWADNELLADVKGYELDEFDEDGDKDSELSERMEYEY
ncbi:unnamed protein product [Lactuca virosa]|uniref:Uncharacterized protein n=1 Tax=Lactuca virosa TaxID=75947 RepID=A0AAU9PSF6_9ASTR|nr:unnamed protein product [Lactuca virosa]